MGAQGMDVWPEIRLPGFEGTLEALYQQVERGELPPEDLPVGPLATQVVAAFKAGRELDLEQATGFLILMARLLERKTRSLLPPEAAPAPAPSPEGEESPAGTEELVERLLEYRAFREAAGLLKRYESEQAQRFPVGGLEAGKPASAGDGVTLDDLLAAFQRVWERAALNAPREIAREQVTVAARMAEVLDMLQRSGGALAFASLFTGQPTRRQVVVSFLALLELVRLGRVRLRQDVAFGDILIRLPGEEKGAER